MKFKFHHDAGHGWLEVPMVVIQDLGIESRITKYSYKKGWNAYLEEDCDAPLFLKEYRKQIGPLEIDEQDGVNDSPIRNYQRFY